MTTLKTPRLCTRKGIHTCRPGSVHVNEKDKEVLEQHNQATINLLCELLEGELDGLMEKLADVEHVRWAKWQNYLHSHLTWNNELQAWVLPHEWKARWQTQINTPYSMLSEKEKESDREQVRPYLKLIKTKAQALIRQTLDPISNQE